jgi:hypothetical protein
MKRILEISAEYGTHFVEASTEAKKAGLVGKAEVLSKQ